MFCKNSKKLVYYNENMYTNSKFQTQFSRKLQRFRTCRKNKKCSIFHELSEYQQKWQFFSKLSQIWTKITTLTPSLFSKNVSRKRIECLITDLTIEMTVVLHSLEGSTVRNYNGLFRKGNKWRRCWCMWSTRQPPLYSRRPAHCYQISLPQQIETKTDSVAYHPSMDH
jgi:hypothetical protein